MPRTRLTIDLGAGETGRRRREALESEADSRGLTRLWGGETGPNINALVQGYADGLIAEGELSDHRAIVRSHGWDVRAEIDAMCPGDLLGDMEIWGIAAQAAENGGDPVEAVVRYIQQEQHEHIG